MKIKALCLAYLLGIVITFGNAANNERVPDGGAVFASAIWPFYVSYELWRDNEY